MTIILFSWPWGKMIHEKNLKQKISCHCPFKNRILTLKLQKLRSSFLLLYPYPGFFLTDVLDQTVKKYFFSFSF
jgi:hypothetical protein